MYLIKKFPKLKGNKYLCQNQSYEMMHFGTCWRITNKNYNNKHLKHLHLFKANIFGTGVNVILSTDIHIA